MKKLITDIRILNLNPYRLHHRTGRLLVWGLAVVLLSPGCRSSSEKSKGPPKEDVVVIASADTKGWIEPCGCASGQSGGLSRRATLARQLAGDRAALLVSAGGATSGARPYDVEKLRAIVAGEAAMGYSVHNVGLEELLVGVDRIGGNAGNITFVATNTIHHDSNMAQRSVIIKKGGWRFLFLGVLQPGLTKTTVIDDPQTSILNELETNSGGYDVAIVLAYMDSDSLKALADTLPEVDVIIGGMTGQSIAPKMFGRTLLTAVSNKGKFIAQINGKVGDEDRLEWSADLHEVTDSLAEDDAQQANLKTFRERLGKFDFSPDETSFVSESLIAESRDIEFDDAEFAGSTSCASCHEEDTDVWMNSPHAHAWKTLQDVGADVDSSCQRCHATGYGLAGGFVNRSETMDRINVGCESCHGPSSRHVQDTQQKTPWQAADSCLVCHDHENSPKFEYDAYWERITHGASVELKPEKEVVVEPKARGDIESKTDEVKTDEVKTDEVKTDDVKTDDVKTDDVKTDDVKTDDVKTDDVKTDDVKTDDVKTDDVKTDDVKTDDVKTDDVKTDDFKATFGESNDSEKANDQ